MMSERRGEVKWLSQSYSIDEGAIRNASIRPKYSRVSESLRFVTPSALQCSLFCGGKQCKYDNPAKWNNTEMAIRGLYSSWITDSILATSRPSASAMEKYDIIDQFKSEGISAIINLQHPGEHISCGPGLLEGGFTYDPQQFMDSNIFFYNFNWDDYGVRSLPSIADMVKVMDFALSDGKVAVHCHAGLGRTGVLIACYLIYADRIRADQAIHVVRRSRPRSIQTRGQIRCVRDFEKFIAPCWDVFRLDDSRNAFSLELFLRRQNHVLHGEETRVLRYVPKVIVRLCNRLLILADLDIDLHLLLLSECRKSSFRQYNFSSQQTLCGISNGGVCDVRRNKEISEDFSTDDLMLSHSSNDRLDGSLPDHIDKWSYAGISSADASPLEYDNPHLPRSSSDSLLSQPDLRKAVIKRDKIAFQQIHLSTYDIDTKLNSSLTRKTLEPLNINVDEKLKSSGIAIEKPLDQLSSYPCLSNKMTELPSLDDSATDRRASMDHVPLGEPANATLTDEGNPSNPKAQVIKALAMRCGDFRVVTKIDKLKRRLNQNADGWDRLDEEESAFVLAGLLFGWMEQLESPLLSEEDIDNCKDGTLSGRIDFYRSLSKEKRLIITCLMTTINELRPMSSDNEDRILRRLAIALTADRTLPRRNSTQQSKGDDDVAATGQGVLILSLLLNWEQSKSNDA